MSRCSGRSLARQSASTVAVPCEAAHRTATVRERPEDPRTGALPMFKFLIKWGLILLVVLVVWWTVTGTMHAIYWWMDP